MQKAINNKAKLLTIALYLLPIFVVTILTQRIKYFILSTGIMSILLCLSMFIIPNQVGFNKDTDKDDSTIYVGISGLLLILVYIMQ